MHGFVLSRRLFWAAIAFLLIVGSWPMFDRWLVAMAVEPRAITPRGDLAEDERTTIAIFERVSPSVVYITTLARVRSPWSRNLAEVRRGTGSGFVWDRHGHVVTNHHVVAGSQAPQVRLADGRTYPAAVIGSSPEHDLAVLRIDVGSTLPDPVMVGVSEDLRVGQRVLAIGNPFGLDHSLTAGIVSALDRTIVAEDRTEVRRLIQTDAAINPGNSGGPLIDSAGRLIGVNTAIFSPSGGFSGIGFAVPVDTINRVVPQLIAHGRYLRPRLGIVGDDAVSRVVLAELGTVGVLILRVEPGSPAAAAGLRGTRLLNNGRILPGDIVQSVDGQPVRTMRDLIDALEQRRAGERVELGVWRDRQTLTLGVVLGAASPLLD